MTQIEQQAEAKYPLVSKEEFYDDNMGDWDDYEYKVMKLRAAFIAGSKATESAGVEMNKNKILQILEAKATYYKNQDYGGSVYAVSKDYWNEIVDEIIASPSQSLLQQENERRIEQLENALREIRNYQIAPTLERIIDKALNQKT